MKIRALNNNWDWTFGYGNQSYKNEIEALKQNVKSRILCFFGDCFFDMEFGINWFQLLGYRGEKELQNALKNMIVSTEGVIGIKSFDVYIKNRIMTINYTINTEFGVVSDNLTNSYV